MPLLKALATDPLNSSVYQVVEHSRKTNSLVRTIFMNSQGGSLRELRPYKTRTSTIVSRFLKSCSTLAGKASI